MTTIDPGQPSRPKAGRGNPPVEYRFKPGNPGKPKGARDKSRLLSRPFSMARPRL